MTPILGFAGGLAVLLAPYRWSRVAQREHYIPGSCARTARRWLQVRPPNGLLGLIAFTALVGAVVQSPESSGGRIAFVVGIVLVATFPIGMPLRGNPHLKATRRATTMVVALIAVCAVLAFLLGLVRGPLAAVLAVGLLVPVVLDAVLLLLQPLERRASERFRQQAEQRLRRVDPYVIAVTGSWGKTSTKNHIRDLLVGSADAVASPASWNNTAGLSRTVNEHLSESTEVFVAEMGMYGPGEIQSLCSWVRPRVSVVCAVGPMHLERVGSIEGIAQAKEEILELAEQAVLWVDEPLIAKMETNFSGMKVWRVGRLGESDLDVAVDEAGDGKVVVYVGGEQIGSCEPGSGVHAGNVGCAVAACLAYGASVGQISSRLATLTSPSHRGVVGTNDAGVYVVDDTFNSNPVGARAAVSQLSRAVSGKKVLVTPGMIELGQLQEAENRALARGAVEHGMLVVVVGWTNRRALADGAGDNAVLVASRTEASRWVREHLGAGDGVVWENDLPDHYP